MAIVVRNKKVAPCISLIIFLIAIITKSNAQQGSVNLQKIVVIPTSTIQLDSLLHLINKQTGAKFSLNTQKVPASKKIHIQNRKQSINGLLKEIKQNTGVYYAVLGDHIILLDNPPASKLNKPAVDKKIAPVALSLTTVKKSVPKSLQHIADKNKKTTTSTLTKATKNTAVTSNTNTVTQKSSISNTEQHSIDSTIRNTPDTALSKTSADSTSAPLTAVSHNDSLLNKPAKAKQSTKQSSSSSPAVKSIKERQSFTSKLFAKGGLATEDVFYCSPTIQAGLPFIYGIASWNTNFKISVFRYGVGFSIPLKEQWRLHLQATTGKLPTTSFDTTVRRMECKSSLHRAAFIAETNISDRFTIQFGPVLNLMQATFYRGGQKTSPGLTENNANSKFHILRPVYTIINNYSSSSSQFKKMWAGLQASIFYNLYFFKRE